jgi:hypothetical protein
MLKRDSDKDKEGASICERMRDTLTYADVCMLSYADVC